MSKDKDAYKYTAVYTGRRLDGARKVLHQFKRTDNGKEMHFKGVTGVYLGYAYKCGANNISKRPERTDAERVDNADWEALDAVVDEHNARNRANAKLAGTSKPHIRIALEAIKPLLKNVDYFDVAALIKHLVVEAHKEVLRRKK